jgi:hypothetical protein
MRGDFERVLQEFVDLGYRGIYLQEAVLAAGYVMSIFASSPEAVAHFKARWTETVKQIPWMAKKYLEVPNDVQD